jgi:hypothetical protein
MAKLLVSRKEAKQALEMTIRAEISRDRVVQGRPSYRESAAADEAGISAESSRHRIQEAKAIERRPCAGRCHR